MSLTQRHNPNLFRLPNLHMSSMNRILRIVRFHPCLSCVNDTSITIQLSFFTIEFDEAISKTVATVAPDNITCKSTCKSFFFRTPTVAASLFVWLAIRKRTVSHNNCLWRWLIRVTKLRNRRIGERKKFSNHPKL